MKEILEFTTEYGNHEFRDLKEKRNFFGGNMERNLAAWKIGQVIDLGIRGKEEQHNEGPI